MKTARLKTPKKEPSSQVSARVPSSVKAKIKAIADERYQGKIAMIVRDLIVKGAESL